MRDEGKQFRYRYACSACGKAKSTMVKGEHCDDCVEEQGWSNSPDDPDSDWVNDPRFTQAQ